MARLTDEQTRTLMAALPVLELLLTEPEPEPQPRPGDAAGTPPAGG